MCTHEYIVVVVDAAASVGVFVVVNAPATHGRPLFSPISSSGIYMSFQSAATTTQHIQFMWALGNGWCMILFSTLLYVS